MRVLTSLFRPFYRFFRGLALTLGWILLLGVVLTIGHRFWTPLLQKRLVARPIVLVHALTGPLAEHPSEAGFRDLFEGTSLSLREMVEALDHAAHNPQVKGVILRLDHAQPGLAQIQELQMALRRFRKAGKFALAHADTFGELDSGMGPYYLATACSEIMLQPVGTLSIPGLAIEVPFIRKLLDDWEILPRFDQRKEYKSILETFTKDHMTEASRTTIQAALQSIMNKIVQDISREREIPQEDLWSLIHGAPVTNPQKAQKLGLIDRVGYYDQVEHRAQLLAKTGDLRFTPLERYSAHLPSPSSDKPRIAVIYGAGTVTRTSEQEEGSLWAQDIMGSEQIRLAFDSALQDPQVKAIVLRINSGGGAVAASETIRRQVQRARRQGLPVIASFSDLAASGGYWMATPATKIVAHPATLTGSIGVAGGKLVLQGLWKKWGIQWDKVAVGQNAGLSSSNFDYDPAQWTYVQEWLDTIYEEFLTRVAEGRHLPRDHVEAIAKGRIWSGADALKHGLVDQLGDLTQAIHLAKEAAHILPTEETAVVTYPRRKTLGERLLRLAQGHGVEEMWTQAVPGVATFLRAGLGAELGTLSLRLESLMHSFRTVEGLTRAEPLTTPTPAPRP